MPKVVIVNILVTLIGSMQLSTLHKGAIKFLQLLAEKGADFSLPDKEGQTPLHLATNRRNHDGACVRYILKKIEANYIDLRNHQGQSALHCAAYFANVEAVRLLTKSNANPDLGDINGKTPLHFSASNCQSNAAKTADLLLTLGSSTLINWQDYEGQSRKLNIYRQEIRFLTTIT